MGHGHVLGFFLAVGSSHFREFELLTEMRLNQRGNEGN